MSQIKKDAFVKKTLLYLGAVREGGKEALESEILACFEELEKEAAFRICYEKYALIKNKGGFFEIKELALLLPSKDLLDYFDGCDRVCVICATLGLAFERYMKKQQKMNMSHSVVLDAAAGAYLELMCDAVEEELSLGPRTYRFAPGYGDLPLELNAPLAEALLTYKRIGVSHTGGGLFLPQKSMLGLIGLGREKKEKSCGSCVRKEDCFLRKEGTRCWM